MVIPTHIAEKGSAPSFREREETRRFYTETLLHTEAFTHRHFYTQTLSHRDVFHAHTDVFSHAHFYTQTLLHTHIVLHRDAFTHKGLYAQKPLHADTFTDRHFYTQTLCTQTRLHAEAFTSRRFSTQTLWPTFLHTDPFTHRHVYTQKLLHLDAFPHRRFYTDYCTHRRSYRQNPLHTGALQADAFARHTNTKWCFEIAVKRRGAEVPTLVQSTALDAFHQKHSSKTQAGAKLAQESPQKLQIARSCIVRSLGPRWDRLSSSSITQTHVDEHFPFFEPLVALMRVHTFVTNSLYRQTTVGYWFSTFATNSFSRRTVVQINLRPPHSVPCATQHANLPASTKPPRHRGDCAKGARQVFLQQQLDDAVACSIRTDNPFSKCNKRPQCVHKRHGCATWTKHFALRNPETWISVC